MPGDSLARRHSLALGRLVCLALLVIARRFTRTSPWLGLLLVVSIAGPCLGCNGRASQAPALRLPATGATTPGPPSAAVPHATAELLADTTAVAPGKGFLAAVRIKVPPGWHIYWENPGESGLPTRVTIHAPSGFRVGPVRYPGPDRFDAPGPIISYGYQGEAALFAEVTPPGELTENQVALRATARWLACKESCVPGKAELALSLPAAAPGSSPRPAHPAALAPHLARLPRPLSELVSSAGAPPRWGGTKERPSLQLALGDTDEVEVFPATGVERIPGPAGDPIQFRRTEALPSSPSPAMTVMPTTPAAAARPVPIGVLRLSRQGVREARYYELFPSMDRSASGALRSTPW